LTDAVTLSSNIEIEKINDVTYIDSIYYNVIPQIGQTKIMWYCHIVNMIRSIALLATIRILLSGCNKKLSQDMRLLIIILYLAMYLLSGCNNNKNDHRSKVNNISHIEPYQIVKGNTTIILPDSLRPNNFKEGMVVIDYLVDSTGEKTNTSLGLLRVLDNTEKHVISYRNEKIEVKSKSDYPDTIQPYLDWIFDYADTRVVEKIAEPESNQIWKLSIMLRIK